MIKIIAEIGINHNGDIQLAKKLIDIAAVAGCDYVKFQKRTPDICVAANQKDKIVKTPWGELKYIDYKYKIEFGKEEYDEIFSYCSKLKINCFASVWDAPSVDFMKAYTNVGKIPSALITNPSLCQHARLNFDKLIFSTGMSTEEEVQAAALHLPDVLMHTNSSYPARNETLNLNYIKWLIDHYPCAEIGYSGHEYGLITTFAAVAMGAKWIERHITLDRNMWGSDQLASVEPIGVFKLVKGIRDIENSLGSYGPRTLMPNEIEKKLVLRGN